ncbi:MAG: hypothetical protein PHQ66_02650 [Candidatus Nanoarchaeia archaeon]|nr:hypothetical protein [Candidatus Nanoarchaeia archaeon]MDD5357733.1 hypothetical protein [Candidatus Nanoarchaeia archaeon]MDD5588652.1 hypothetical protein [Candidatus Nanoarchaeia archaeon]
MENKHKMNAKKLLVSFLLIASVLFLATAVSAADIASDYTIEVDSVDVTESASVIAGETAEVKIKFTADDLDLGDGETSASNVRIKVTLEGEKADVTAVTPLFDVEEGKTYVKTLVLKVPSELKDDLSDDLTMDVKIWNSDFETEEQDITLRVQRPSYDFAIKSVSTSNAINAGQSMPVEVVLKNVGYNDADDVYVTVSIPELNVVKSAYFGDLVALEEDDEDDEDTASGKLYLEVPYTAQAGVYTLVVEVENDETTSTVAKEITIENGVSDLAIRSGNDLIVLNPTSQLKVYTVNYNGNDVTVVVPAVSSKNVAIEVPAGDYNFDVTVLSGETVLSTVAFSGTSQETVELTNPVFVLTVILSIVFLVLLVVLVVLITKKPQKTEEFGESYY